MSKHRSARTTRRVWLLLTGSLLATGLSACSLAPDRARAAAQVPARAAAVDTLTDAELAALPATVSSQWARGLARPTVRFATGDSTLPCGTLAGIVRERRSGIAVEDAELYRWREHLPVARTDGRGEFRLRLAAADADRRRAWTAEAAGLTPRVSLGRAFRADAAYWIEYGLAPLGSEPVDRDHLLQSSRSTPDGGKTTIVEIRACTPAGAD